MITDRVSREFVFVDDDGILWQGTRLCVPEDPTLREALMTEAHSSPFSIHPGSVMVVVGGMAAKPRSNVGGDVGCGDRVVRRWCRWFGGGDDGDSDCATATTTVVDDDEVITKVMRKWWCDWPEFWPERVVRRQRKIKTGTMMKPTSENNTRTTYDSDSAIRKLNMETTIEIRDEFMKILQDNPFNGRDGADVFNHIAKVLEILEWIKIPNVDKDQLRLYDFPISLSGHKKK
ncbi:hypothetical protein Tco_0971160 [Tanacetum coccineum]